MDSDKGRSQGAALVVGVGKQVKPVTRPDTHRLEELGGLAELVPFHPSKGET